MLDHKASAVPDATSAHDGYDGAMDGAAPPQPPSESGRAAKAFGLGILLGLLLAVLSRRRP
jgi:hypothetical protein